MTAKPPVPMLSTPFSKKEQTELVEKKYGLIALAPVSWLANEKVQKWLGSGWAGEAHVVHQLPETLRNSEE